MNETNQPAIPANEEEITQEHSDLEHSQEGAIQNEKTITSPYVLRSPSQLVNSEMFAVLRADGTVVSWGAPDYGGSTTDLDGVTTNALSPSASQVPVAAPAADLPAPERPATGADCRPS